MMNSILRWLHKNDALVHMSIMLLVFYGIPSATLAIVYPSLVAPLANSALMGLTLIFLLFVSYRAASAVTTMIKNAAARALLDQIRDVSLLSEAPKKEPVVDYTSPNMLVIGSSSQEKKQDAPAKAVEAIVTQVPVEKKKRAPKAKLQKKEG